MNIINSQNLGEYLEKAYNLFYSDKSEEALCVLDDILRVDSTSMEVLCLKGFTLNKIDKYKEATHVFNKALKIKQKDTEVSYVGASCYGNGCALNGLGKYNEAVFMFDRAIKDALKNDIDKEVLYSIYYAKGSSLDSLGRRNEALESFNTALEITQKIGAKETIYYKRGIVLEELGSFQEALESYNQVLTGTRGDTELVSDTEEQIALIENKIKNKQKCNV
ncbi:MAG: tetratricopeptide repeat protein [bacterium]